MLVKKVANISKKIILIMIIFQFAFIPISNAAFWDDVITAGDNFISVGEAADSGEVNDDKLTQNIQEIYNALLALGVVVSVIIGALLGIKFLVGSVEEQAKTKELLMPYAVGCIVVFGAFGIWKIVINVLSKV